MGALRDVFEGESAVEGWSGMWKECAVEGEAYKVQREADRA